MRTDGHLLLTNGVGHAGIAVTQLLAHQRDFGRRCGTDKTSLRALKGGRGATKAEIQFQTGASNSQKWALDWARGDIIVLYSSDIGVYAYELTGGKIVERLANEDEKEVGRNAYEKKYGKRPSD